MKVHAGDCRPNGGPIPCQGQHMYYCALPPCGKPFLCDLTTHTENLATGKVHASPSYPCCGAPHLILTIGSVAHAARKMGVPGAAPISQEQAPAAPLIDVSKVAKGG